MTILQILEKAGFAVGGFVALLEKAAIAAPDLAPAIHTKIAQLNAVAEAQALVDLAQTLPAELVNIGKGKLDPRDHPSSAA